MTAITYPCSFPRCPALLPAPGRCPAHALPDDRHRVGTSSARGYTYRWHRRAAAFRRRYPLCGMRPHGLRPVMSECHARGIVTVGFQVDHVIPHRGDPRLFWDEQNNWQTLCASCGSKKSGAGL